MPATTSPSSGRRGKRNSRNRPKRFSSCRNLKPRARSDTRRTRCSRWWRTSKISAIPAALRGPGGALTQGAEGRTILVADMTVGYKAIRETFTSQVLLKPDENVIDVKYLDGPFKYLTNIWRFEPAPAAARCVFSSTMSSKADLERRHGRDVRPCFPHVFRCVRKTGGSDLRCGIGESRLLQALSGDIAAKRLL
jgi:hypothetical protein